LSLRPENGNRKIPVFLYSIRLLGHFGVFSEMTFFRPCYAVFRGVLHNMLRELGNESIFDKQISDNELNAFGTQNHKNE
jgi:hypothetical protein